MVRERRYAVVDAFDSTLFKLHLVTLYLLESRTKNRSGFADNGQHFYLNGQYVESWGETIAKGGIFAIW